MLHFPTIQLDSAGCAVIRFPPAAGQGGERENIQNKDIMKNVKSWGLFFNLSEHSLLLSYGKHGINLYSY